ncbi:MAG TPA: oligosaccharide flippase family protein [Candidatus Hydrogenedentes bacterium]|mgnify:CR=1 FL=1|nr:oligosaccharide flippase family protein [Candidatus Hydrogenedentota bacterium]HOL76121.1 oligosaccharide flippase family protein [Candidatus Hydrogenedentota bacterium]HPO84735.1 oligosaccharide flippase family protein [Candidatus Hydrogenedentota bacterium]
MCSSSSQVQVRRTITRNTLFNAAGRTWEAILALVLTPYIVHRVGVNAWGLWAFLSSFVGYVGLLDLGITGSYAKYIAHHHARNEQDEMAHVISTGLSFYAVVGFFLIAVGWFSIDQMVQWLSRLHPERAGEWTHPQVLADLRFLLRGSLVLLCLSNCLASFTAIQSGLQRMGITNGIAFAASLVKTAFIIGMLETGFGVRALLYAEAAGFIAFAVPTVVVSFHLLPGLRLRLQDIRLDTFKRLVDYGWKTQVAKLSNLIMFQTDKVVAGVVFRQFGLVGLYDLGIRWANVARQVPVLLLSALVPAVSDLDAREENDRLKVLYLRSSRYIAALSIPMALFLASNAGLIMRVWLGKMEGVTTAAWVLRIIALGYVANILPGAGVSIALGKGRPDLQMIAGLISMSTNIVFTILFVFVFGFYGIPAATALSMFLSCAWFFYALRPVVDLPVSHLVKFALVKPVAAVVPACCVSLGIEFWANTDSGRVVLLFYLLGSCVCFTILYGICLRLSRFFDDWDLNFFTELTGEPLHRLLPFFLGVRQRV